MTDSCFLCHGLGMSKITDPKWWFGRTDDQKDRRAAARVGMKRIGNDLRANNQNLKDGMTVVGKASAERREENHAKYQDRKAELADEWSAKKDEMRADRQDRRLGGWGWKRR